MYWSFVPFEERVGVRVQKHEFCFRRLVEIYHPVLMALSHLYTERNDAEAFGILLQMIDPTFVLVSLMLTDILGCVRRLTLWLQKSPSKANITDLPLIVKLVVDELNCLLSHGSGNGIEVYFD